MPPRVRPRSATCVPDRRPTDPGDPRDGRHHPDGPDHLGVPECPGVKVSCTRLTWSLTPHSPAAGLAPGRRRHPKNDQAPSGAVVGTRHPVSARPRRSGTRRAGLTPKPHHAQRPRVALRGSFRLRLASTCNHRPDRSSPRQCTPRPPPGTLRPSHVHDNATRSSPCRNQSAPAPGRLRVRRCAAGP